MLAASMPGCCSSFRSGPSRARRYSPAAAALNFMLPQWTYRSLHGRPNNHVPNRSPWGDPLVPFIFSLGLHDATEPSTPAAGLVQQRVLNDVCFKAEMQVLGGVSPVHLRADFEAALNEKSADLRVAYLPELKSGEEQQATQGHCSDAVCMPWWRPQWASTSND